MATAFVFDSDTNTESDYDGLMASMGLAELDSPFPDGLLVHLSGAKPGGGWRVIDVWESDDAANTFYSSDRFAPIRDSAADAGITTIPWPLHRIEAHAVRDRV